MEFARRHSVTFYRTSSYRRGAYKILFPKLVPGHEGIVQLGIYGGAVKIAMIMALITQAFRYAYEPFVFAAAKKSESTDNRATYALTMKYFLIFTLFASQ